MLKTMVDIRNLVTLTSFIISTTIELVSVIREGICRNFFSTKDCRETPTKKFTAHRIRS